MQVKPALIICGVATGLALSVYSILTKFGSLRIRRLWFGFSRGQEGHQCHEHEEKAQKDLNKNKMLRSFKSPKPLRMWIDGKCFNIRKFKRNTRKTIQRSVIHTDVKNQTVSEEVDIVDIECKNEIDVIIDDNGKASLSFHLPSIYYTKLHRFTEFDIKYLSDKTQTNISWPKHGQNGKLTITGQDKQNIEDAVNEVHSVIGAIREQLTAAQFISIPILSSEVQTNFEKFKAEILNGEEIKGMHESIFQSPLKLHLTVIVFALSDEREKAEAVKALEDYKNNVLCPLLEKTGPLRLRVEGIDCMKSNYKKTDVLYANVKVVNETDEANLQKIANDVADYFYERGLVLRHTENVKLHMTLINTKYRKSANNQSPSRKRWVKRESFDASPIMQKYKDFAFGECDFDSIHLSLISTKGEDGFYKPLSVIKL